MRSYGAILLAVSLLSVACSHPRQPAPVDAKASVVPSAPVRSVPPSKAYESNVPPTRKEILRALLASQDVSLAVDRSCSGVGTETSDANIGDYISGFLAEQKGGKNWLQIDTKPVSGSTGEAAWDCSVVIRHVDGDDRWGWGVSFQMKAADHSVVKASLRCTGSG